MFIESKFISGILRYCSDETNKIIFVSTPGPKVSERRQDGSRTRSTALSDDFRTTR